MIEINNSYNRERLFNNILTFFDSSHSTSNGWSFIDFRSENNSEV